MPEINKDIFKKFGLQEQINKQKEEIKRENDTFHLTRRIATDKIQYNPLNTFFRAIDDSQNNETIKELAVDIERHGLQQPIIVLENGDGTYRLLSGERRTRAIKEILHLREIDAFVHEPMSEMEEKDYLYQANIQTRTLTEEHKFILITELLDDFDSMKKSLRPEDLPEWLKISESSLRRLRILYREATREDIQLLREGEITLKEFRQRTNSLIKKRNEEIELRKAELEAEAIPKNYIDKNSNTIYTVINNGNNRYFTMLIKPDGRNITVPTPGFPLKATFNQAQTDLDVYAETSNFPEYTGDINKLLYPQETIDEEIEENEEVTPPPAIYTENNVIADERDTDTLEDFTENEDVASSDDIQKVQEGEDTVTEPELPTEKTSQNEPHDFSEPPMEQIEIAPPDQEFGEIASFYGLDITTGAPVEGALYMYNNRTFIITKAKIGNKVGKSSYEVSGFMVEVNPKTITRQDI